MIPSPALPVESGRTLESRRIMELRRYREGDMDALTRLGVAPSGAASRTGRRTSTRPRTLVWTSSRSTSSRRMGRPGRAPPCCRWSPYVEGEPRPMGGISAVMVHPAYRRRGYAGELMRAVLRDMRERDVALSLLVPLRPRLLQGLRLRARHRGHRVQAQARRPPDQPGTEPSQGLSGRGPLLFDESLRSGGEGAYPQRAQERRTLENDAWPRKTRKSPSTSGTVSVEGYILYKISGWQEQDPRRTLTVDELVAATLRAREALYSFMAGLDPLVYGIKLFTPRGEPLHPYLRKLVRKREDRARPDASPRRRRNGSGVSRTHARGAARTRRIGRRHTGERGRVHRRRRQGHPWGGGGRERLARRTPARPALRRVPSGQRSRQARAHRRELSRGSGSPRLALPRRETRGSMGRIIFSISTSASQHAACGGSQHCGYCISGAATSRLAVNWRPAERRMFRPKRS